MGFEPQDGRKIGPLCGAETQPTLVSCFLLGSHETKEELSVLLELLCFRNFGL